MTDTKTQNKPADAVWEKAQSVIKARILALREKQAEAAETASK